MTVSKLNVYISALGQPCTIDNDSWVVAIAHCNGNLLNWSEGRYRNTPDGAWINIGKHTPPSSGGPPMPAGWWYDSVPASNGHVEIEVPPGSYVITASKHTWTGVKYDLGFLEWVLYGNWATEHAIVTVGCDEDECVRIYAPTVQLCWNILFNFIFPLALRAPQTGRLAVQDREAIQKAAKVLDEKLFKPLVTKGTTDYEARYLEHLSRVFSKVERSSNKG